MRVDLEPHDVPGALAQREHALDRLEQVVVLVVELEVGVAGDAERVVGDDLHAGEQPVEVRGDHLLERHEPLAVGHHEEAGEQRRDLHPGEALLAGLGVATTTARFSERFEM